MPSTTYGPSRQVRVRHVFEADLHERHGERPGVLFQVKPWAKYVPGINRFADYIVEFRR